MINHLFLKCNFFGSIWHLVQHWLGISIVVPSDIGCHVQQLFGVYAFRKGICSWSVIREFSATKCLLMINFLIVLNFILGDG